jgi:hypothetical protein
MRRLTKKQIIQAPLTLPELYELTEEALADLPKPPCAARTCNGCCWSPPTITDIEFQHIQDNVRLTEIVPASEPWCRFYEEKTGACRIYAVRPLECRLVAVLDTHRFMYCAPAAQPEPMPPWATLLREMLYRVLHQIDGKGGEAHINTRFDLAVAELSGHSMKKPGSNAPLRSWLSRVLFGLSFRLVQIARRLTVPPTMEHGQTQNSAPTKLP